MNSAERACQFQIRRSSVQIRPPLTTNARGSSTCWDPFFHWTALKHLTLTDPSGSVIEEKIQLDGQPLAYLMDPAGRFSADAVRTDAVSCRGFAFTTVADTEAMLILSQMHDRRWNVSVNDVAGAVVHANRYFMGVRLGPGENKVSFVFSDPAFTVSSWISASTVIVLIALEVWRRRRSRDALLRTNNVDGPAPTGTREDGKPDAGQPGGNPI